MNVPNTKLMMLQVIFQYHYNDAIVIVLL